jgi:hypothetical protein
MRLIRLGMDGFVSLFVHNNLVSGPSLQRRVSSQQRDLEPPLALSRHLFFSLTVGAMAFLLIMYCTASSTTSLRPRSPRSAGYCKAAPLWQTRGAASRRPIVWHMYGIPCASVGLAGTLYMIKRLR